MVKIAAWAKSEEDVRYESNKLIDEFLKKAGIKVKAHHEYGLAGGRIDSKYGGVILPVDLFPGDPSHSRINR